MTEYRSLRFQLPLLDIGGEVAGNGVDGHQSSVTDWIERFTALDNATRSATGDPAGPRTPAAMRDRLASFELEPGACFLALAGDEWIGYTLLDPRLSTTGGSSRGWTGVRAEHRRRGIATALKALGIEYARAHGFDVIVTAPRRGNLASFGSSTRSGLGRRDPEPEGSAYSMSRPRRAVTMRALARS